jgi:Trk K+ transport system NAD-binding subunit
VIVLTGDDSQNHKICKHLKEIGHERIITNAKNPEIEEKIRLMDIHSLDHTRIIATTIENYIIRPTTYHALVETFETFIIEEIKVINKEIDGMLIKNFPVPKDSYLMLIKRGDEMYIPHGDSDLRAGDIVTAFGTESALNRIRQQLFI